MPILLMVLIIGLKFWMENNPDPPELQARYSLKGQKSKNYGAFLF